MNLGFAPHLGVLARTIYRMDPDMYARVMGSPSALVRFFSPRLESA